MMARIGRTILRLLAGALIVFAALAALLIWRVAEEPIAVDFLLPVLRPYLSVLPPEIGIEIENIVIAWDGEDRSIGLHATEVAIREQGGPILAHFPAVGIGISLRGLVHGVVALTAVKIKQPSVVLVRRSDGSLTFAGADLELEHDGKHFDAKAAMRTIAQDMLAAEDSSRPLSYLRQVRVSGGSVLIRDAVVARDWRLPVVDLALGRNADGLSGHTTLNLAVGDGVARVDATLAYAEPDRAVEAVASFANLRPRDFSDLLPDLLPGLATDLAELAAADLPLRGSLTAAIDPFASIFQPMLAFHIEGAAGVLSHPRLPGLVPVRAVQVEGRLDGERERLEIDQAIVAFGSDGASGPILALSGVAQNEDAARTFAGILTLRRLPMAEAVRYWPQGLAEGARRWVTRNISGGLLDSLEARIRIRAAHGDIVTIDVEQSDGTLSYRGLDVHYLREVPAVTGLAGTGTFSREALHLQAREGTSQNLGVHDVAIDISGLAQREQVARIGLGIAGDVRDAMELLDHPRFDLVSKLGILPADTGGSFAGRMALTVPLKRDVAFDDIGLHFAGRIDEASIRNMRPGFSASNGQLDLDVDTSKAHVVGPVQINGIPIQIDWTEAFTAESPFATKARITADHVDDAARSALGVDLDPFVHGPLSLVIDATLARGGVGTINASADVTAAALALPFLHWRKESGSKGEIEAVLAIDNNRPIRLTRIRASAGSLNAEGTGEFDAAEAEGWLDFDQFAFANSALSAVSVQWTAKDVALEIGGGTLDAAPFVASSKVPGGQAAQRSGRFLLSAENLERVTFAEGRFVENVFVRLQRSAGGWERIEIDALIPSHLASAHDGVVAGPQTFSFRYGPLANGAYPLLARISDTGGLLRAVDAVDGIKGGYCEIAGKSDGATPGLPMRAKLSCQRITDTEASPLGKVLNALSISGIRQALAGEGITFDRADGDIVWHKGIVTIVSAEANNSALGVTFEGRLAMSPHHIEARGTVIPAYTVNRLIGRIPLIGGLLNEGQGFFAAHFRVSGKLSDPKITAQPIKSITPSILVRFKNLFTNSGGRSSAADSGATSGAR